MIIDFHIHTCHSPDCRMRPEKVLKIAKKKGLTGIVINDHNTIMGGLETKKLNKDKDFKVIVGAEIQTDAGHISGILLKEEIQSGNYADVVQEIKNQGGIVVLNHPYKGHKLDQINFDGIDLIEGYNSRLTKYHNELAVKLAREKNKPIVAGSDSHIYSEIGNCKTIYMSDNLLEPVDLVYKRNIFYAILYIQSIFRKEYLKNRIKIPDAPNQ